MRFSTDGLVIREQIIKEQDKLITVLTRSNGVIHAFVHGAKSIKSPKSVATGLLTYSRFTIFSNRERYIVDEANAQDVFMPLRKDITKLALAQYFCELLAELAPQEDEAEEYLRLVLNSLFFVSKGNRPDSLIKSTFELRLLTLAGYMPDLVCCNACACYESEDMYFLPKSGTLVCGDCAGSYSEEKVKTGLGITAAMRHCVYSEFNKLFSFSVTPEAQPTLEYAVESYLHNQLGKKLKTLDFYKQLLPLF